MVHIEHSCDAAQCTLSCAAAPGCSYLEQEQHMFLTAHCLDVEFAGTQHHMQIDLTSVEALELIKPLAAGAASKKGNSLYRYSVITPRLILVKLYLSVVCAMPVPHLCWGVSQ